MERVEEGGASTPAPSPAQGRQEAAGPSGAAAAAAGGGDVGAATVPESRVQRLLLARELRRSRSANALNAENAGMSTPAGSDGSLSGYGDAENGEASPASAVRDRASSHSLLLDLAQVKSWLIIVANRLPYSITKAEGPAPGTSTFGIEVRRARRRPNAETRARPASARGARVPTSTTSAADPPPAVERARSGPGSKIPAAS